ncbi:MAG: amino acid adenylation domain-containing protein, partial [Lysobacter sp.]
MNDHAMPIKAAADGIPLLDVLPIRAVAAREGWQRQAFALDTVLSDALAASEQRTGVAPNALLLAALAVVEARLTGAECVLATLVSMSGAKQTMTPISGGCIAISDAPGPSVANIVPAAWTVLDKAAALDDAAPIMSGWRVAGLTSALTHTGARADQTQIDVVFRAPLTAESVDLVAGCVRRALAALIVGTPIGEIDVLDPVDRSRQLDEWGATPAVDGLADTINTQFARVCARTPEAIAVVDGRRSMSYAELDHRSDVVAARLATAGVQAGAVVAVSMERSAATVVAALGILKAGAAYLPIDATQPRERVAFMLDNAGVRVAVTDGNEADAPLPESLQRIEVTLNDELTQNAQPVPTTAASGDSIAYVMYTSGSTGEPKGVEIRHRGILRLVCGVGYADFGPQTRYLQVAPLGFDASTLELWAPLLNGGCVVVHRELVPTGAGLAASIREHQVTTTLLTAALLNAVIDEDPLHLAGLRELLSGGEAMSVDHVRRLRAALPALRLVNAYGPTECSVIITTYRVPSELPADIAAMPIGRPIADTRVYVLNARRGLVPSGVMGELYVGGSGLARGYVNREDLTADRFVTSPFIEGERLYRTGDQVRFRADGQLEFVGRSDNQVKIRGFRIELSEIELALSQHPDVRSCAVLARVDRTGGKQLLAYYTSGNAALSAPTLRAHLAASLPEYMIPARYLRLETWPLTANGKLDSKALPAPDRSRPELGCAYE